MNINTFFLKFKNTMATIGDGTITLKVDAPLDTTGTLNFSVDTLNTVPTIDATKVLNYLLLLLMILIVG